MKYIKSTADSAEREVQIHYADHGQGIPVVLRHGWPLTIHIRASKHADRSSTYQTISFLIYQKVMDH